MVLLRRFAPAAIAVGLAMVLSFIFVSHLLNRSTAPTADPGEVSRAADLRAFSNELVVMLNDYAANRAEDTPGEFNTFERWVARSFQPNVNNLRQRLLGQGVSSPEHSALLAASDRTAAMAFQPRDDRAYAYALEGALEAARQVDARVADVHAGGSLIPRPIAATFARP